MMIEPQSEAVLMGETIIGFPCLSLLLVIFFNVIFIITVIFNIIVIIIAVTFDFFYIGVVIQGIYRYLRIALGYEITATSESSEEKGFVQHKTAFNF